MISNLKFDHYSASYNKNQLLFKPVSYDVNKGDVIGIIGENGCGKTTFIKGILGLVPYISGKVIINSNEIKINETHNIVSKFKIGYLSQRERVYDHLSVIDHLRISRYLSKNKNSHDNSYYQKLYKIIRNKLNNTGSSLSGGEKLVLNLLCIIIDDPDILLLDEPSDSLDINIINDLEKLIMYFKHEGKSIIIVEHNLKFLKSVCDKILHLEIGGE